MLIEPFQHKRHEPENVNVRHNEKMGTQDKIALAITTAAGTMYAVYFLALFMAGWMLWQGYYAGLPFDPYPFAFLLFLGNIVQLLLMPLIMVGQNLLGRHAEIRADEEYKYTYSSYKDIEHILTHLDAQDKAILEQTKLLEELTKVTKK
jgi:uncharacterized membrane protein